MHINVHHRQNPTTCVPVVIQYSYDFAIQISNFLEMPLAVFYIEPGDGGDTGDYIEYYQFDQDPTAHSHSGSRGLGSALCQVGRWGRVTVGSLEVWVFFFKGSFKCECLSTLEGTQRPPFTTRLRVCNKHYYYY